MPKLKPETQIARRAAILDAAEVCFARNGFHRTTMHDICAEAGISPGAFYVYFASKEDLIAGICERDRAEFGERFQCLADADDTLAALSDIARVYLVDQPPHKRQLSIEIGAEATRNPRVREVFTAVEAFVEDSFATLITRLVAEGRARPQHDPKTAARLILILGDGLFWRTGISPEFDAEKILPSVIVTIGTLLGLEAMTDNQIKTTTASMETVRS